MAVVPPRVAERQSEARAEGGGRTGMTGGIRLRAEVSGGRTRIADLWCRPPLQVLRAHHVDPALPDLASVTIASPSGGILQGDRLEIDIHVGPGARVHVGTQSASRLYRAPRDAADQAVRLAVESGGHLEFLPDPYLPYRGSRFASRTRCELAADATLILWETVGSGRVARGEVLAFERFESVVEIARPDGELLATDAVILDRADDLGAVGLLGRFSVVGSLIVAAPGFAPDPLRAAAAAVASPRVLVGASTLPGEAGAWLRVLATDLAGAAAVLEAGYAAARFALLGVPPAPVRRL